VKNRFMLLYHTELGEFLELRLCFLDEDEAILGDVVLGTAPASYWTLSMSFEGGELRGYVDTAYFTFTVDLEKVLDVIADIVKDCVVIAEWEESLDED